MPIPQNDQIQTIRLNVFGRFVGLTLKELVWNWLLRIYQRILGSMGLINVIAGEIKFRDLKTFITFSILAKLHDSMILKTH